MRAARLLQMLLILQNRGRQSCASLARTLEVSRRTVLRDIDALTEAGLPVVTHRGAGGGVDLGFDYRTRLTGLDAEESEAMALLLTLIPAEVHHLGLARAAARAQAKLREAFPDQTRARMARTTALFPVAAAAPPTDPRREAIALAVREGRILHLQARSVSPATVHPVALALNPAGWVLSCGLSGKEWPETDWGDINLSNRRFAPDTPGLQPRENRANPVR